MANTAKSTEDTVKNLTKVEIAARQAAEKLMALKPAEPPIPFQKLNAVEMKIFNKVREYNDFFSDGDAIPLTDLAISFVQRERYLKVLKKLDVTDEGCKALRLEFKYWDDKVQQCVKILKITIGDRMSLAYEMSKVIQDHMAKENDDVEIIESSPVSALSNKY